MAAYGEGRLGQIVSQGGYRLELTWENDMMLWLGRMLVGEPGVGGQTEWAALLWTYASRAALRRTRDFVELVRSHSQPINPNWARDGEFCKPGGVHRNRRGQSPSNYHGLDPCSPDKLDRRDHVSSLTWEQIPEEKRAFLLRWARAQVPNPVPRSVDFAAQSLGTDDRLQLVWTIPGERVNAFYSNPASRNWIDGYVSIVYNDQQSEETEPEQLENSQPRVRNFDSSAISPSISNEIFERNSTITVSRTAPPNQKYQYATVESEREDPQAEIVLDENQEELIIREPHERFYQQVSALKRASTLEFAQTVPVIKLFTQNELGEIVDLNEIIFSKSPIHNIVEISSGFIGEIEFPERPLASIESFQTKIEPPSVGGVATITTATLKLKIYNPSLANVDHPQGKYISYMMRQGFFLRVRYGIEPPMNRNIAFQWKEQDFIVAQHNLSINNDKTCDMDITLIPAASKLFNQIHIGESIPFSDLGANALTEEDIDNVLQSITSPDTSQEELNEMRRRMNNFRQRFNSGIPSVGYRMVRIENENEATIGSVLHGAISQSRILENTDDLTPVPIENMVDALRSIQSILLTRRIQNILERDAYRTTIKGIARNVIGIGPLIFNLALPEMEAVAIYVSQNQLKMGEEFSADVIGINDDITQSNGSSAESSRRSNVKLVFGRFNSRAGQWANLPISAFPINVEAIFSHLRQERDVGQFSSTINNFLSTINSISSEMSNFTIERDPNEQGEPEYQIEVPQLKYLFYPDPTDEGAWIMYIYDYKSPFVRFRDLLLSMNSEDAEHLSKSQIIEKLNELRIPWVEMGEDNSIIKTMEARTHADDLIAAHNIIMANRQAITIRDADGNLTIPSGISRDFLDGAQLDPQNVIRQVVMIMPLEVSMTSTIICTAIPFAPIYIFFPIPQFSALYSPMVVDHEVRDGMTQTRFVLHIQITRMNRIAGN